VENLLKFLDHKNVSHFGLRKHNGIVVVAGLEGHFDYKSII